jgi:hypothetical protein
MAELLIVVVIAGVVLLYAVDRTRKLRARARQMSGMNERLDVAAAKVDAQQKRKQARVRASAELTSVLPAIRRPPLTLPGDPGSAGEPAAPEPDAGPAVEGASSTPSAGGGTPAAADDTPAAAEGGNIPDTGAAQSPAAQPAPAQSGSPDAPAAPGLQVTSDGTMIIPPVPDQGPAPADGAVRPPAFSRPRPRTSRPPAGQPRAREPRAREPRASRSRAGQPYSGQPHASQPGSSQPGSGRPGTSQEQSSRD